MKSCSAKSRASSMRKATRGVVGLIERLQDREGRAGTDVGAEADADRPVGVLGARNVEHAATQEEIRRRAMRDRGIGGMQALQLIVAQPDAMTEHRAPAAEPVMIVDVEIVPALGEQFLDPGDFGLSLRDVRLHQAIGMVAPQRAGGGELLGRTGAGEARRDGIEQASAAVPFEDECQGVVVTRLHVVAQPLGRIAVHQYLAGGEPQAERFRLLEQDFGGMGVHGAVDATRRDSVAQVLLQERGKV